MYIVRITFQLLDQLIFKKQVNAHLHINAHIAKVITMRCIPFACT
jgi:hypothetical protein